MTAIICNVKNDNPDGFGATVVKEPFEVGGEFLYS